MKVNIFEERKLKNYHENKGNDLFHRNINIISQKEEDFLSSAYLFFKICLFLLVIISLFKTGYVTKVRISRLKEIKNSYNYEKIKFSKLSNRFDSLFSLQGEQRFMKDQDQMISRDILRVIWR